MNSARVEIDVGPDNRGYQLYARYNGQKMKPFPEVIDTFKEVYYLAAAMEDYLKNEGIEVEPGVVCENAFKANVFLDQEARKMIEMVSRGEIQINIVGRLD